MAFNQHGQAYFTFEDLDFNEALFVVCHEIEVLIDYQYELKTTFNFGEYVETLEETNAKIQRLTQVMHYIACLKRGQKFND